MKRQLRQARYRKKPEVRLRRIKASHDYYERNKERLKARARARYALGGDPERIAELRGRFRIIGPGERIPPDASLTTRNSCGTLTNGRADIAFILEARYPAPDGPWGFVTGCPDLSTLLALGGKGENLALKEFVRDEMVRRFPDRYPDIEDLPTEDEVLRRHVGPPDIRATEKRVRKAKLDQLTPDFQCPNEHCGYFGPMVPNLRGPLRAGVVSTETRKKLGAKPDDLLPGAFCPQCRGLISFSPGTDLSPPLGGNDAEYRCRCGFKGPLSPDPLTGEYNCPECGLVVGETVDTVRPRSGSRNSVA